MTEKYNGWTNYATWRVNLEMIDGLEIDSFPQDLTGLADSLRDYIEGFIEEDSASEYVKSYAFAFLSDVNWYEIAQHLLDERV